MTHTRRFCGALLAAGALATSRAVAAQGLARNSVYVELLGNAGLFSLDYDRRLGTGGSTVRVGVSSWESTGGFFFSDAEEKQSFFTVPLMLNVLTGRGTHHLELGAGMVVGTRSITRDGSTPERSSVVDATATVGYRRQRPGRGVVFRVGFTPFYGFGNEENAYPGRGFTPSVGLSLGYGF